MFIITDLEDPEPDPSLGIVITKDDDYGTETKVDVEALKDVFHTALGITCDSLDWANHFVVEQVYKFLVNLGSIEVGDMIVIDDDGELDDEEEDMEEDD